MFLSKSQENGNKTRKITLGNHVQIAIRRLGKFIIRHIGKIAIRHRNLIKLESKHKVFR